MPVIKNFSGKGVGDTEFCVKSGREMTEMVIIDFWGPNHPEPPFPHFPNLPPPPQKKTVKR